MDIQIHWVDIIVSVAAVAFTFFISFMPSRIKFYRKLNDPIRIIKQNIKWEWVILGITILFVLFFYSITLYTYFTSYKKHGIPYNLYFLPISFLINAIIFIKSSKKTLKELEKAE